MHLPIFLLFTDEKVYIFLIKIYMRVLAETLVGLPIYLYKTGLSFVVDRIPKDRNFKGKGLG
ncbi:hypothetical protein HMPREF0077_0743 [Anaerococcus tetradius ATCC 35098]|uniref:Uncharacterized protein n=2 Tax=Anaerococcus tetradius TaxID=33036 RepID=C2CGY3_9FIRM|nr:hypothetical protein HMPREF0077_0743 [Anaerococcus tetradius ATCC 35098]KWZ76364.1 hypothetical protein HMPREF3200_01863 [Anaerococcus tetradius]